MSSSGKNLLLRLRSYVTPVTLVATSSRYASDINVRLISGQPSLYIGNALQSGPKLFRIWEKVFCTFAVASGTRQVSRALVMGVGGGDVIRIIRRSYPAAPIDAVDIDGDVVQLAREYFGLSEIPGVRTVTADAATFIRQANRQKSVYDLIVVDLYAGLDVPDRFSHGLFLANAGRLLSPNGIMILNYSPSRDLQEQTRFMLDKLRKFYQSVDRYGIFSYRFFSASGLKE